MVIGAIQGALLGLLISLAVDNFRIFFPCDIIAFSALLCAVIGYIFGERVVEYLTDLIRKVLDYLPHGPS
ncbi:hypothetical protein Fuma_00807 [Fuerstiella marisgermanici]|uniref:Uncharacterized protein n=2 Tax=Fuerstiella marisgermanici TaxID=1891926 RepID=A0A1P8WAZ7_9PLAN|nr:hypothetical protein Fuma_00807 [Fuerstiella marisgermanici]